MRSKFAAFLTLTLAALSPSARAADCVPDGRAVGIYPDAPPCCPGLELVPPAPETIGIGGVCRAPKNCVPAGKSIGVRPNPSPCCPGLELIPPPPGLIGVAGTCERPAPASDEIQRRLSSCESKLSQIEQLFAAQAAPVAAGLAKRVKVILENPTPASPTPPKSSAGGGQ